MSNPLAFTNVSNKTRGKNDEINNTSAKGNVSNGENKVSDWKSIFSNLE